MENLFFARTCKITALIALALVVIDFRINFFGLEWHYYLIRSIGITILILMALKSRNTNSVPLVYYDIYSYTLYAMVLYGMVFVAPAYTFSFMHTFIAIGISTHTSSKRFLIQSVVGFIACAIGHYFTPQPKIIAAGEDAKLMMFATATIFQMIAGFIYIFVTRFRLEINKLNEQYALIGKKSSFLIHEIKTPLSRIYARTLGKDQPELIENINKESKRILNIIESVEGLIYRPEVIAQTFEFFPFKDIKDRLLADYEHYLKAMNISLKIEAEEINIFGNRNLIYQLMKNIVDNAIEAIGYLKDQNPLILVKAYNHHESTIITIRNTHSYFPPHCIKKAFAPYFTTKRGATNKGIGLTLSKSIVQAHGGKIWVTSDERENFTEFEVRLPIAQHV